MMDLHTLTQKTAALTVAATRQREKEAIIKPLMQAGGWLGKTLGGLGGKAIGGLTGGGLKGLGKSVANAPLTTLAAGGLGAAGLNEGVGYLDKQMGGGFIPHFGSSRANPMWNQRAHNDTINDARGLSAIPTMLSKPMQTLNYLIGNREGARGPQDMVNMDYRTLQDAKAKSFKYNPDTGRVEMDMSVNAEMMRPYQDLIRNAQKDQDRLKQLGMVTGGGSSSNRDVNANRVPALNLADYA
jgi:hypothetical protein